MTDGELGARSLTAHRKSETSIRNFRCQKVKRILLKMPAGHRNRHACAANKSTNHSNGQILYGSQQRERRRRRRYDFSCAILCCQTQIRWANRMGLGAWVTHLFSSSVFSYSVLLFTILVVSFPLHERRATSIYVIHAYAPSPHFAHDYANAMLHGFAVTCSLFFSSFFSLALSTS